MAKQRASQYNPVPLPQTGYQQAQMLPTAGAVVYGDTNAANNLAANINYVNQSRFVRDQQLEAEKQRVAQMWRDNMLEAQSGNLWSNQIGEIEQRHLAAGEELMREGINPYESMNPRAQEFRRERQRIEAQRAYRQGIEKQYLDVVKQISANPNKYDPRDVKALNDFVSGTSLADAYNSNLQLPTLRERFDPNQVLKNVKAITESSVSVSGNRKTTKVGVNRGETERMILNAMQSAPGGAEYLNEITGGIPVAELKRVPSTLQEANSFVITLADGDPDLKVMLASQGIAPDTPEYDEAISAMANDMFAASQRYKSFIDGSIAQVSSGVQTKNEVAPDFTEANYNLRVRDSNLRAQREARLAAGESRDSSISFMGDGVLPAGSTLSGVQTGVMYRNAINLGQSSVNMPGSKDITVLSSLKNDRSRATISGSIATVGEFPYNKDTGEIMTEDNYNESKVVWRKRALVRDGDGAEFLLPVENLSQFLPDKKAKALERWAKNGTTSNETMTATRADIKSLVGQAGYEGYTEQELIDYYKSQGYTIK